MDMAIENSMFRIYTAGETIGLHLGMCRWKFRQFPQGISHAAQPVSLIFPDAYVAFGAENHASVVTKLLQAEITQGTSRRGMPLIDIIVTQSVSLTRPYYYTQSTGRYKQVIVVASRVTMSRL